MSVKQSLPDMTHGEVLRRLQLQIEEMQSIASAARVLGVSQSYLSQVMAGKRMIGPQLLRALKLRRVTLVIHRYEPIERCAKRRITVSKLPRGPQTVRIDPD